MRWRQRTVTRRVRLLLLSDRRASARKLCFMHVHRKYIYLYTSEFTPTFSMLDTDISNMNSLISAVDCCSLWTYGLTAEPYLWKKFFLTKAEFCSRSAVVERHKSRSSNGIWTLHVDVRCLVCKIGTVSSFRFTNPCHSWPFLQYSKPHITDFAGRCYQANVSKIAINWTKPSVSHKRT